MLSRALEKAKSYARIPRPAFRITKRQLRQPTLDHLERNAARFDDEVERLWSHPDILNAVKSYVERTIPRKS